MKAARINEYGSADKVAINEVEPPRPGEGQVLVEVHAASLNPFDTAVREGRVQKMLSARPPFTPGGDVAGVVTELGEGIESFAVGDKVYGSAGQAGGGSGALAEYAVTKAGHLAAMPEGLDFIQAASIPLVGLSAMQVLEGHIKLRTGQKILIHGGAGGIGSVAIELAKHIGAYVATTTTGTGIDYARKLGADEVIDYQAETFEAKLHDYDAVFDTVGGDTYERSFKVLKRGGVIVSMLVQPNEELAEQYGVTAIVQGTKTTTEDLQKLAQLVEEGAITPQVGKVFPLEETVEAFKARESGEVHGKVVVQTRA